LSEEQAEEGSREEILKRFGVALRVARLSAGISQEELALRAKLDRTYVGGAERGERNVSLVNICRLAAALEIRPDELLRLLDRD